MINRKVFFKEVRKSLFRGRFSQSQVDGLTNLLDIWEGHYTDHPWSYLAASLGTAFHETGATMQPIKERGGKAYLHRMYDIKGKRPEKARELGNIHPGDGVLFAGAGHVQNTGRANARKSGAMIRRLLGVKVDFEKNPKLRQHPVYSAHCLYLGCINGLWTGRGWKHYVKTDPGTFNQFKNSRRVVNGTDKASLIAGYCVEFQKAIQRSLGVPETLTLTMKGPKERVTAENPMKSTTSQAAAGLTATAVVTQAETVMDIVNRTKAVATDAGVTAGEVVPGIDWTSVIVPAVVIVAAVGFGAWIIRERLRKRHEYGE